MMAITKTKQLLNELGYLVMASTANAFISPLLSCVCRQICFSSFTEQICILNQ